ncbi:glucose-1-phosphate adenylyltransferase [Paenibacillus sacheonensis]|uniref:Glucose-1-phosphate adenylyltransferase n=1 Tax=Paenibacillus sacheonensis TaxID=742054 RepID=A0A7X5BZ94_9BACL|nr:glucose-1-phosphate adenylyltransferase [Paenibacillus sacheonensis]MBM7568656.1 glucose-1-phosphate adenylyltransferase [Paenibacillus sacheonensis]NBC72453.1 glucose-1-phosphate adenylyltransferase [Paenibacillus sacheonensis]
MNTNSCVAMLLAGGEGRRLAPLTESMAKPAVPFGGNCRIIDYTLSNCINSGIGSIGVLTQYMADSLHKHIGDGSSWHTNGQTADITLLPSSRVGENGYLGTADAIYQNIDYIDRQSPEHVLILSGDHIYRMDYRSMLQDHVASGAAATIAVKRVPWRDASRFGIMTADERRTIVDFVEKPAKPTSNLASMGIYIFKWQVLRDALMADRLNPASSHDFGKDIIPALLRNGTSMLAHAFDGYWRDVGTVESLWEAHMDLIDGELEDAAGTKAKPWPILSRLLNNSMRTYVCPNADVQSSYVHHGSSIKGDLDRSVVFGDVAVEEGADIRESILMPGSRIGKDVRLSRVIIGEGAVIEDGAVIGSLNGDVTVIAPGDCVAAHPRFVVTPDRLPQSLFDREAPAVAAIALEKA